MTLRISGFFRDAFPAQIALFDRAIRAIGALDEPEDENPIAARMRTDALGLMARRRRPRPTPALARRPPHLRLQARRLWRRACRA